MNRDEGVRYEELNRKVERWNDEYQQDRMRRQMLCEELEETKDKLAQQQEQLELWEQVERLLVEAATFARAQVQDRIESTVTAALQAVFETTALSFHVELTEIGAKPAAYWYVVDSSGDEEVTAQPEDALGGGVVDVVSLALRLVILELQGMEGPILADEPGKMISRNFQPHFGEFLSEFLVETDRQGILITHDPALASVAERAYEVIQRGKESVVRRLHET